MNENKKNRNCNVVITGSGIISSLGQGVPDFTEALLNGKSRFSKSERYSSLSFPVIAAEIKDFDLEQALAHINSFTPLADEIARRARRVARRAPFTIQTSVVAAFEAWENAHLTERKVESNRIGLIVAGQNTTQRYSFDLQASFQREPDYLLPSYALHFMDTDQVGTISEIFKIQGEGLTVGGASAGGNAGIIQACRWILSGVVDVCMVIGVLADLSPLEIQGFYNIGALGGRRFKDFPDKSCRPFDRDHEGFIYGQASACLILESEEKWEKTNISSLGKVAGMAMALDGNHSADPQAEGEARVMQQALANASMTPGNIDYINAHGSASVLGDEAEVKAIRTVFGEKVRDIWLNSTKSLTGHCLWSAGVVEAIATLIQLQHGFVHPNLNLDHPIDLDCDFVSQLSEKAAIQTAMSNSFGFGGINTSLILTKGE